MIHVENLVKTYGQVKAVDGISFDVTAGEIFAFLGPNGAGKTTTIQMLTTLVPPTSGAIRVDGLDPQRQAHEVRRRFMPPEKVLTIALRRSHNSKSFSSISILATRVCRGTW